MLRPTARVTPDLLKTIPVLSVITVRRSSVQLEELKLCKKKKEVSFLELIGEPVMFFKNFANY